jgi:hypothetical protein
VDGDGLSNSQEFEKGSDPTDADTDNDTKDDDEDPDPLWP